MKPYHFLITIVVAFVSCKQNSRHVKVGADVSITSKMIRDTGKKSRPASKPDSIKIIRLKDGFFIKGIYDSETEFYKNIELWHGDLKITTDTTQEYLFDQQLYPIFNKLKPGVYELLLRFDNRPSADLVTLFRIENNGITKKQRIPLFESSPRNINGAKVYTGIWDYGEPWDEDGKTYVVYNPTLYYKFTDDGLLLDTPLTILKNKQVYGKFRGFNYNGGIGYPSDDRGHIIDTADKNVLKKDD